MRTDPILRAARIVEDLRSEMEWIWSDSGYDYFGEAYQAAQECYDDAVRIYNATVQHPRRRRYTLEWKRAWA